MQVDVPGDTPAKELAKEIKNRLVYKSSPEDRPFVEKLSIDSIEKLIPSGTGMIVG